MNIKSFILSLFKGKPTVEPKQESAEFLQHNEIKPVKKSQPNSKEILEMIEKKEKELLNN